MTLRSLNGGEETSTQSGPRWDSVVLAFAFSVAFVAGVAFLVGLAIGLSIETYEVGREIGKWVGGG